MQRQNPLHLLWNSWPLRRVIPGVVRGLAEGPCVWVDPRRPSTKSSGARDPICVETDDVEVWFRQSILGGSSHRWVLTLHRRRHNGSVAFTAPAWIACAVNIKGAADVYCPQWRDDGADPNENLEHFFNDEDVVKNFGATGYGKKYPMLTLAIHYAGQPTSAKGKFRGWDTCINSTQDHRLCTVSGTGG